VRSDQYPFVRRGVPALYVGPGYVPEDPAANASRGYLEWLRTRYHTPTDDLAQPIDWSAALLLTEFDYRLGLAVANADARPRWKPGDFFGETFARR
jgi:Zn-dependent M28 family amino/carboxypeptidase